MSSFSVHFFSSFQRRIPVPWSGSADVKLSRKVEKDTTATENRSRIDHAATRQAWVAGNDSAVKRRYDVQEDAAGGSRGRGNGNGGYNGGRGGFRSWRGRGFGKNKHFRNVPY
jgi:hypothetical protein